MKNQHLEEICLELGTLFQQSQVQARKYRKCHQTPSLIILKVPLILELGNDLPATNGTPTAGALLEKNGKVGVALGLFFFTRCIHRIRTCWWFGG